MLIAQDKLESNIAEYVIYLFQIEDLIRAYHFDIKIIKEQLIIPQISDEKVQNEAVIWYTEIIDEMKSRDLINSGHIYRIGEAITELIYLHNTLKDVVEDEKYIGLLNAAEEPIETFRKKSDLKDKHLIEVCFNALYMKLLLKLKKKEIHSETEKAFDSMRIILAYLTKAYHQMKKGDMSMFEK